MRLKNKINLFGLFAITSMPFLSFVSCSAFTANVYVTNSEDDGFTIEEKTVTKHQKIVLNVSSLDAMFNSSLDSILINGKECSNFVFKVNEENNFLATITIPAKEVKGDIYVTFVSSLVPPPKNFETDSWETIFHFANRGISSLILAYGMQDASAFLGLERYIELNGQIHRIKVVGVNHDFLDSNHKRCAALTFQFDQLVSNQNGHYLSVKWQDTPYDEGDNKNYWDSTLMHALNDEENDVHWENDDDEKQSVYAMIKEGNAILARNIKNVYRKINVFDENIPDPTIKYKPVEKYTKVFCPTISNYFSEIGIEKTGDFSPEEKKLYCDEGKQYEFYAQPEKIGDSYLREKSYDFLKFKDCIETDEPMAKMNWITTPCIHASFYESQVASWFIWQGSPEAAMNTSKFWAIAPCFCI